MSILTSKMYLTLAASMNISFYFPLLIFFCNKKIFIFARVNTFYEERKSSRKKKLIIFTTISQCSLSIISNVKLLSYKRILEFYSSLKTNIFYCNSNLSFCKGFQWKVLLGIVNMFTQFLRKSSTDAKKNEKIFGEEIWLTSELTVST